MGKKLTAGMLLGLAGLGCVGGYCYNTMPSFKNTINNIFKNNKTKSNISFDNNDSNNDDSAIKPILPGEFLKTYKYELPTTFLGGNLYVKVLKNNNLLVSSSVVPYILVCDAETGKVTEYLVSHSKWIYYYELENGNCIISSSESDSGLCLYNASQNTISKIYDVGYNFTYFEKTPIGNYIIFSPSNCLVSYDDINNTFISLASSGASNIGILSNGNCLYSSSSSASYSKGVWLVNTQTGDKTRIYTEGYSWKFSPLLNGNCLISSDSNSILGAHLYTSQDDSIIELTSEGYSYRSYSRQLTDNILFVCGNSGTPFLWDLSNNSKIELTITGSKFDNFIPLINGDYLVYSSSSYKMYLLSCSDFSCIPISSSMQGPIYSRVLKTGDVVITCNYRANFTTNFAGIYLYSFNNKEIVQLHSSGTYWNKFGVLSNGNCLIGSDTTNNLIYLNIENKTIKTLLIGFTVSKITEQDNGTYLIETSDEFDYEYDSESDTIRLVYKVEI